MEAIRYPRNFLRKWSRNPDTHQEQHLGKLGLLIMKLPKV